MTIKDRIKHYIQEFQFIWETNITPYLVDEKWNTFEINKEQNYSTLTHIKKDDSPPHKIHITGNQNKVFLEYPSLKLNSFYQKHGLCLSKITEDQSEVILKKLFHTFELFKMVDPLYLEISRLVRSIHILDTEYEYLDISYSNPNLPFSIFISLCKDSSSISSLRVAESILHETMHLKLSLIETFSDIVDTKSSNLFYSPWREEKRPAQGVLHGLYVFRGVYDFYEQIKHKFPQKEKETLKYISKRQKEIKDEFSTLSYLPNVPELSKKGKLLTLKLLQILN